MDLGLCAENFVGAGLLVCSVRWAAARSCCLNFTHCWFFALERGESPSVL